MDGQSLLGSTGIGGGTVVGWLLIVVEEPQHNGKTYYANFKHTVWHEAFKIILSTIKTQEKQGAWVRFGDSLLYLFPIILILSVDYEEQAIMSLIHSGSSDFPCNICLILKDQQSNLQETYPLRNNTSMQAVIKDAKKLKTAKDRNNYLQQFGLRDIQNIFWGFPQCDPYHVLSFDHLHVDHDGIFGYHILGELIKRIHKLPSAVEQQADEQLKHFPWWQDLYHFKQGFMNIYFTDGKKYEALSKLLFAIHNILTKWNDPIGYILLKALRVYLELDMYAGLTLHTMATLEAGHLFNDIEAKGILRVDQWITATTYIRHQIKLLNKTTQEALTVVEDDTESPDLNLSVHAYSGVASVHDGHGKGGGRLSMEEMEAKSDKDFQMMVSTFMMKHFKNHPEELPLLNEKQVHFQGFKADEQITNLDDFIIKKMMIWAFIEFKSKRDLIHICTQSTQSSGVL
ncbi:hypothetical protein F5146DRAFT_1006378 [Armillaria mellea]|nr:hypothetical protein F5146DRAFT_1006378 [Armillaria mellea]